MRNVLAFFCLLFALGCSGRERPGEFVLRVAAAGELAPFHPRTTSSFTASATELVYQRILRVNEKGEIRPGAVLGWERLGPGRARLQIDPTLRFSDGSAVSPSDVVTSLAASGLEVRPAGEWLEVGSGVSRDPLEVTLLYTAVFRDAAPAPLGTGPFRLVDGDAKRIVLERLQPRPGRVDRVEIEAVPTPRDAFAKALRGDANAVVGLDERQSELMEGVPGLRIVRGQTPNAVALMMNPDRFSRQDRLALASALPLPDLARAYGKRCTPLDSSSLRESLRRGRELEIATGGHDPGLPRVALALRRALGVRGGDVAVEPLAGFVARARRRDFDFAVATVVAWPPVMLGWFARTGAGANFAGYSNLRVDEALDRGDMAAVLDELHRDPPLVLVCRRERIAAVDARITNPTLGSWGLLETLPDWEVSP